MEQLSPSATTIEFVLQIQKATTTEPTCPSLQNLHALDPMLPNERSHHNKKSEHCNWRVAPAHCN